MDAKELEAARRALATDQTIDIVTIGARSGERRTTEIWFAKVGDEIFITGTPAGDGAPSPRRPRDWLANLTAHPEFEFVLKESVQATLPEVGTVITDRDERTRVFSAPETAYYRGGRLAAQPGLTAVGQRRSAARGTGRRLSTDDRPRSTGFIEPT